MKASVIVATFNRQDVLCRTLPFLLAQQYQNFEIIVVDQTPSMSASLNEFLRRTGDLLSYHRLSAPNLPAARNVGVMKSTGDIVIFIDDDVVVGPHFVEHHMRAYANQSVSGVTGLCLPSALTDRVVELELRALEERHHAARPLSRGQLSNVSWLPGCHMSFRRAVITEAGMFDEFFTGSAHCEDVDMSCRLRTLGHRLIVDTRIELIHLAIAEGGCGVRSGLKDERAERHRFALTCYCRLKNRRLFGLSGTMAGLVQAYRAFALNRELLRRGVWYVIFRQWSAVRALCEAVSEVLRRLSCDPNHGAPRALPYQVAPWKAMNACYSKVQKLVTTLIRGRSFQSARARLGGKRHLNVGCGLNCHPRFINLDYRWLPGVNVCWDVTKGLRFESRSLAAVVQRTLPRASDVGRLRRRGARTASACWSRGASFGSLLPRTPSCISNRHHRYQAGDRRVPFPYAPSPPPVGPDGAHVHRARLLSHGHRCSRTTRQRWGCCCRAPASATS